MEQQTNPLKTKQPEQLINDSINRLAQTIDIFNESNFNQAPFDGSWTAAQTSEHIIKSLIFIHQIVHDETGPTSRNPEEYIPLLKEIMENMAVKRQAAPNLIPGKEPMPLQEIQNKLLKCQKELLTDARELDLSATCKTSEFPNIGMITRAELLCFSAFHTQRHTRQINNIYKLLLKKYQ